MATVSFLVPDDIQNAFNEMFFGTDQNAIISNLMTQAIAEEQNRRERTKAIDAILALRQSIPPVTAQEIMQRS